MLMEKTPGDRRFVGGGGMERMGVRSGSRNDGSVAGYGLVSQGASPTKPSDVSNGAVTDVTTFAPAVVSTSSALISGLRYGWTMGPTLAPAEARAYADALGIDPAVAQVLHARGVPSSAAGAFLAPPASLIGDPYLLLGMDAAVRRIKRAIIAKEKITVYGDFDVDGVSATVSLLEVLQSLGARVDYVIPSRAQGHGFHADLAEALIRARTSLIVTVDVGITATDAVRRTRLLGADVIITDHHEPDPILPDAFAIINPLQPGCTYGYTHLSGAGLVYKLITALVDDRSDARDLRRRALECYGLGTIADLVPLDGENRVLGRAALRALSLTEREGLRALYRTANIEPVMVAEDIAFAVAPRMNAAGRLAHADLAVRLLTCTDRADAEEIVAQLEAHNTERKRLVAAAMDEIGPTLDPLRRVQIIVGQGENWKGGILGLVAGRVREDMNAPTFVLALGADGMYRGSGRSPVTFNAHAALTRCGDLLEGYGGHARAAGLSLRPAHLAAFTERMEAIAVDILPPPVAPTLAIDASVYADALGGTRLARLHDTLDRFEPCGMGNDAPILSFGGVQLAQPARRVGKDGAHAKLRFAGPTGAVEGIAFYRGVDLGQLRAGTTVSIAATPRLSTYGGPHVELRVRDMAVLS